MFTKILGQQWMSITAVYLVHTGPSCSCLCEPPDSSVYPLYSAWSYSVDYSGGPNTTF